MRARYILAVLVSATLLFCFPLCPALPIVCVSTQAKTTLGKPVNSCVSVLLHFSKSGKFPALADEEKEHLDDFFSILEETEVKPFAQAKLTNSRLVEFGVWYNYLNHPERLEVARNSSGRLPARYVEEAANEFFGQRVQRHQSVPDVLFESMGGYLLPPHNQKETHSFAQVTRLEPSGSQTYIANVNVYYSYNYWKFSIHALPGSWKKQGDDEPPILDRRMRATLQKRTSEGHSHYIVLDYKQVWSRQSR